MAEVGRHTETLSVDLRGHGDSEWAPDRDYTLEAFRDDIVEVARSLDRPPILVGASLGGIAALSAIAEGGVPGLAAGLVLVDVGPRLEPSGVARIGAFMTGHLDGFESVEAVAEVVAAYNPHRTRPISIDGLRKNLRQRADGRWHWHWDPAFVEGRFGSDETRAASQSTRLLDAARAIDVPTLIVRGRLSDLLSVEGAAEAQRLIAGSRLVDIAGAGHMVAGDRNDAFNDAVVSFVGEFATSDGGG